MSDKSYASYKTYAAILFSAVLFFAAAKTAFANATTIVKPNGGECLTVGQSYTIEFSWSGADVEHVALYYRTDGAQPTHLDSSMIKHPINVPQQGTTWNWTPGSSHISETGRVWIDGHLAGHASLSTWDSSDADFSVRTSCAVPAPPPSGGGGGGGVVLAPPKIKPVTISDITTSSAVISWQTDRSTYYRLAYGKSSGDYIKEIKTGLPQSDRADHRAILANLEEGATYYFKITVGIELSDPQTSSEYSFKTIDRTPPGQVRNVFGVAGASTTLLSWLNPPDRDFKEIRIARRDDRFPQSEKDGDVVFVGKETYYTDGELENGTKYYYSIFTTDFDENFSESVEIAVTPEENLPAVPFPPLSGDASSTASTTSIRAVSLFSEPQEGAISLRWQNPEDKNFLGVQIARNEFSLPANAYDGSVIFRGRAEEFTDSGLLPETRYNYGVFAFDWENDFYAGSYISDIPAYPDEIIRELQSGIDKARKLVEELAKRVALFLKSRGFGQPLSRASEEKMAPPSESSVYQVIVTPDGFSPRSITVPRGTTIRWSNRSNEDIWPASDVHPTHEIYPEFDALREVPPGGTYSFKFERIGRWEYHDHLHPDVRNGEIVVK